MAGPARDAGRARRKYNPPPLLSLQVATPENKNLSLLKLSSNVQESPAASQAVLSRMRAAQPFMRLAEHFTRFASCLAHALNACLVGENPPCSVTALL